MTKVLVVGSVNVDVQLGVSHLPRAGETVLAHSADRLPGGKGANQAAALAALGITVDLVGAVGRDSDGQFSLTALQAAGVGTPHVQHVDAATGFAVVTVDDAGENAITVMPGANGLLRPAHLPEVAFVDITAVVLQLEIPLDTVDAAVLRARATGALVVLNAAPARHLDPGLIAAVDVLIVNESEARALPAGARPRSAIVTTLGAAGCRIDDGAGTRVVPGHRVDAVDTTGAGDCFVAALTAGLVRGDSVDQAAVYACAAASLSVQRPGARTSPTHAEVLTLLA